MPGPIYDNIPEAVPDAGDPPAEFNLLRAAVLDLDQRVSLPFPMLENRYYTTHLTLGAFNSDANVFGTSGQRVWLFPMYFAESTPVDRLGQSIAGAGNGLLWLGIYDFAASMGEVDLLVSGSTDASVPGDKAITVAATIPSGPKFGAVGTTDTTGSLRVRRASGPEASTVAWGSDVGWETGNFFGARYEGVNLTSGLPASLDLSTYAAMTKLDVPLLWVRRAAA